MNAELSISEPSPMGEMSNLISLLHAAGAIEGGQGPLAEAIERALSIAAETQQRLSDQSARIIQLERMALTDELTGLANRRGFNERLASETAAARRHGETGMLIYCDLDGFKRINDTLGHGAGDAVLCQVAELLRTFVREEDLVARLGGDEFAILLTRTARRNGRIKARALEKTVNTSIAVFENQAIPLKASFGMQSYGPDNVDEDLVGMADSLMYVNKRLRSAIAA